MDEPVVAAAFERIRAAWRAAGRDDAPRLSASLWFALGPGAEGRLRGYCVDDLRSVGERVTRAMAARATCHTPEVLRQAVGTLEQLGCDELFLVPTTADVAELERTREALGR